MRPSETEAVVIDQRFASCAGLAANQYSQFGEDGIIAALLERLGAHNQWCFEVGAADGYFYSNTLRLREQGWNAALIEGNPDQAALLQKYASETVQCIHRQIGDAELDGILSGCGAPHNMDFGVIDIDGQDYWAWRGMVEYRPRIMMVEFDRSMHDYGPPERGDASGKQAGYTAIHNLGIEKGYVPIIKTHVNLIFIRKDVL